MQEFVVPKSMPNTFAINQNSFVCHDTRGLSFQCGNRANESETPEIARFAEEKENTASRLKALRCAIGDALTQPFLKPAGLMAHAWLVLTD